MKLLSSYVALAAAGLSAVDAAEFVFNNKCSYTINLYAAHGKHLCDIAPGQTRDKSCGVTISHEKPGIFRHTASDQVNLIEYVLNGRLWYDFSNIPPMPGNCNSFQDCKEKTKAVGFNVPMSLTPTRHKGKANCKALLDDKPDAPDAYLFPADTKTHDCPADEAFERPRLGRPGMGVDFTNGGTNNDIGNGPVSGSTTEQLAQCCAMCHKNDKCVAYSVGYGSCYMKSSVGVPRVNAHVSSGIKGAGPSIQWKQDYWGNDIRGIDVPGSAVDQATMCHSLCKTTSNCAGFTMNGGRCYLKSQLANGYKSDTAYSGTKN
ncbi:hypothetical protein SPRG_04871 [Saprolegnia parasitica CBS 223.65]|uniref:Apple domain-containing protein n=1 Tax=Saprolegnia parasitica (strain CBS 223.65) TaxID=695850 RepID=A0A067CG93_SAPPC|nr:hypothetical protein SPRG_04871 [Saprolegnia parasitica CBS 223.65]KDO29754.1 hypothetical protein SPRG_04871 [Saprolegnia parasitica CBS 223.65]|eukprot:XP_012199402.1 hypothetical protein SPRG_04871 [Saprolegnia parasitica CBS 223.65]